MTHWRGLILLSFPSSSFGGYILDFSVVRFENIALHLSAVNGECGRLLYAANDC